MMTEIQAHKIAAAIAAVRGDWDPSGVLAALGKCKDREPTAVLIAFARAARNPDMRTPAVAALAGDHWNDPVPSSAARHPSSIPFGDLCQTHGTHRDACPPNCNPAAQAARRRNAIERNHHWAAIARQAIQHEETP